MKWTEEAKSSVQTFFSSRAGGRTSTPRWMALRNKRAPSFSTALCLISWTCPSGKSFITCSVKYLQPCVLCLQAWLLWYPISLAHYTLMYMPKGAQEKRTEVLENKVDKMWVMHFFNEHMWSHPPVKGEGSAAVRSWEIWLSVWFVTRCWTFHNYYNKPTSLCC